MSEMPERVRKLGAILGYNYPPVFRDVILNLFAEAPRAAHIERSEDGDGSIMAMAAR